MSALFRVFVLRTEGDVRGLWSFIKSNAAPMAELGKPLSVTIQEDKAKRSIDQNKRYWKIIAEIADNAWVNGTQCSGETWHLFFRKQFIGYETGPDGSEYPISTTKLSVSEFTEYMDKISAFAATDLGLELIL